MGYTEPFNLKQIEADFWTSTGQPSLIWASNREDLERAGFTWAKYLRLLKTMRAHVILYQTGEMSLTLFIGKLIENANGALGQIILKSKG